MSDSQAEIDRLVEAALEEDLGTVSTASDVTATWVLGEDEGSVTTARIISRQQGVVAGLDVAELVFVRLDPKATITRHVNDGDVVDVNDLLLEVAGNARALVVAERTALNFLQRLGGIATLTRRYTEAVAGTGARITDTRKTTPGLRHLERHAVRCGGGVNHRFNLADAALIKENHVTAAGGAAEAVRRARAGAEAAGRPDTRVMCEAETLAQVDELLCLGEPLWPDRILLDNLTPEQTRDAVTRIRNEAGRQIEIESTGGIDLTTCRPYAEAGVDLISVGSLTHSAPAMDLSLLFAGA